MAQFAEIAKEIVNTINDATLSYALTAVRVAARGLNAEEITSAPLCFVRLAGAAVAETVEDTRDMRARDVGFEILIAARGPSTGLSVSDSVGTLAEEVDDLLFETLSDIPEHDAVLIGSEIDFTFDAQQLRDYGIAQAAITVVYRV